jgi:(2Fe-2S) ferredoxin
MPPTSRSSAPTEGPRDRIWICRGCCCGTRRKHPGVDHEELRRLLRTRGEALGCKVRTTDCLGPCGQGNVVVVRRGGTVRWFRKMNSPKRTKRLLRHLRDGGDLAALPPKLEALRLRGRDGRKP